MEYSVSNSGELVLTSQPRYLPESIPHNRQNTKVVLLPVPYQGTGAPDIQYQNLWEAPYQRFPYQTLQTFQAQNILDVPYQSLAPSRRSLQVPSQAQSLSEFPYTNLQAPSHSTFQAQGLSAPVHQNMEDMFSTNNNPTGSTVYVGNEIQDTQQSEVNFDMDMTTTVVPEALEGMVMDTVTPSLIETSPGTARRSCPNNHGSMEELSSLCRRSIEESLSSCHRSIEELSSSYRSSIDELSASQKRLAEKVENMGRAWSRFAEDVASDMDENKQWRISIEEKLEQLLHAGDGASSRSDELA